MEYTMDWPYGKIDVVGLMSGAVIHLMITPNTFSALTIM